MGPYIGCGCGCGLWVGVGGGVAYITSGGAVGTTVGHATIGGTFVWPCIMMANCCWVAHSAALRSAVSRVIADILLFMICELALFATWMVMRLSLMDWRLSPPVLSTLVAS